MIIKKPTPKESARIEEAKLQKEEMLKMAQEKARKKENDLSTENKRIPKAPPNISTKKLLSLSSIIPLENLRTGSFGAKDIKEIGVNWFNKTEDFNLTEVSHAFTDPEIIPYHEETLKKAIATMFALLTKNWEAQLEAWFQDNFQENVIASPRLYWGGVRFTNPEQKKNEDKNSYLIRVFRGLMLFTIADSFTDRNAAIYFGACPRCEKIFEKNRRDHKYDRELCQKEHTRKNN